MVGFGSEDNHGEPTGEMREMANPAEVVQFIEVVGNDLGFVDAVPRRAASNRLGVASVDAKFIVEDWATDADSNERVPVILNNGGELFAAFGLEGGGKLDDFVEFGLVFAGIPQDAVVTFDGEVEGGACLAEQSGAAVRREQVQVFIDVVRCLGGNGPPVDWFGPPYFGRHVDDERVGSGKWPRCRLRGAQQKSWEEL